MMDSMVRSLFELGMPWWEFVLRATAVYVVVLVMVRMSGKRTVGQFTPFDLLVVVLLGTAVQNSLIGEDYFEGQLVVDEKERQRVNPFEWETSFPTVFAKGGFDAVVGNPPYIRIQAMREWAPNDVDFYKKK